MEILKIRKLLSSLEALCKEELSGIFPDTNYTKLLITDLSGLRRELAQIRDSCKDEFNHKFKGPSHFFDFTIFQHVSLFLLLAEHFHEKDETFKHIEQNSDSFMSFRYFTLSLCNLINSLVSIKILIELGLNLQANQLIRSYIEYADISVAILAKNDFFKIYKSSAESEENKKSTWWNYTRPKALSKILKEIFNAMHDENVNYWEIFNQIREPVYSHLSGHVHADVMANITNAMAQKLSTGYFELTLLGSITKDTEKTLRRIIIYSHLFINSAVISIVRFKKLPLIHFGEEGLKFAINYKMAEMYFPLYIDQFHKKQKNI